jgi:hypothetical protein
MAENYIITPGGYRSASLVHLVEPGHILDGTGGRFTKLDPTRKVVADYGQIALRLTKEPLMPYNVVSTHPNKVKAVPGLGTGWITYAFWNNATGNPITSFKTAWRIPPYPTTEDGELIYLFNGIQNATMIYQPVLQWGNNGAFGGNYWCVASWYADGQNGPAFYSQNTQVPVNGLLVGLMTQTGSANGQFSYNCLFEGIANSALPIQNVQELTWCAETLEAYGLKQSLDYPAAGKCAMTAIEIVTGNTHPTLNWTAETPVSDTGQHTIVVSNANPNGEVDLYFNKLDDWIVDKTIIFSDTSPKNPSIASLNGRLYIAWKGDGNDNLNVMYSSDNGATFGNKYISPETSPQAPALCAHNGNLYIAWKGDGNDSLNVAIVDIVGSAITGFSNKVTLGDTSQLSPSLASFGGRLYLAWKGDGNDNLNVMYSANNGATFGNKYVSPETSPQAPGLAGSNGNLFITWKGDGNDNLNVATVNISGSSITGFSKVTLGDTSPLSPALTFFNGRLYLSWKGDGNDWLNVMYSTDNGRTFGNKAVSSETSPQPPALCVHNNTVYIAWKGDGNDYLNVAQVGT